MPRFSFVSPGAAAVNELQRVLAEREAQRRQDFLDSITNREMNLREQQEDRQAENQRSILDERSLLQESQRVDRMNEDARRGDVIDPENAALYRKHRPGAVNTLSVPTVTDEQVANAPNGDPTDPTIVPKAPGVVVHRGGPKQLADEQAQEARMMQSREANASREAAAKTAADARVAAAQEKDKDREAAAAGRREDAANGRHERRINQISDQYDRNPIVKRMNIVAEGYDLAKRLSGNPNRSSTDDQALIYAFAKAMDPESVVREGEYATVQKYAQSWLQSFGFNALRTIENREFLSEGARANMAATIGQKYSAARNVYDNHRKEVATKINHVTGRDDGDSYLIDYGTAYPHDENPGISAPVPEGPAPAGTAPSGSGVKIKSIRQVR